MRPGRASVSALLFSSGLCALTYQTAWFRELRLIFGSSTPASAAVLAIFMGGLGLGSALLGKRADASRNPLALFAKLEAGIAISAAMSPLLVIAGRWLYIAAGGSTTLGSAGATMARLVISALILAVPTILMGGTLPAAARAVEVRQDSARRRVALIYAANTFGAVTGAALSTFFLLELLGNRRTLWLAAALNLMVALAAWVLSRGLRFEEAPTTERGGGVTAEAPPDRSRPRALILAAAAVCGFAFFLMEIVWYRALSPLLGGSTYTLGLILAVALGGIGAGGFLYSLHGIGRRPTLSLFALTCAAEALFLAIPYALGDRIAILAVLLRRLGAVGFFGFVSGWSVIVALVALPAAIVAGYQFPLLVALLGKGKAGVGRDAGHAYAWNTAGAIAGSLAGGFGILPLLTLLGTWKLVVVLMAGLSLVTLLFAARANRRIAPVALPLLVSAGAVACLFALGPTEVWRHSPIGAGREDAPDDHGSFTRWIREQRSSIEWEFDGIESTVGLQSRDSFSFLVNGKSDGSARYDAGTQVMSGLIGAMLHPEPRKAFVIGLGTGSTAGWLGRVPGIERVDVAELEPGIVRVAAACVPVNADPLGNPRVRILFGDARELLLTSRESYDVIFSEPSNPYRAGVASLFTKDFYEAASRRLNEGGLFLQWLQGYEIEPG
ncbi:MAG TPA: spermidine synthase, partial [Thermoanaerobaculia bacterium]|nr:spermidine synthase [Thermoanaerobaculia bacterium]